MSSVHFSALAEGQPGLQCLGHSIISSIEAYMLFVAGSGCVRGFSIGSGAGLHWSGALLAD
eukprot:6462181-Amphidinium_carterae.1